MEATNEKALKILEQQYKTFINQQDTWDFFRGLAEYTKTIQEMTQTKPFIDAMEAQRQMARKAYEMMNSQAMKELTKSAQIMTSIAQDMLKKYEPLIKLAQEEAQKYSQIAKAVQEVKARMAGRILSSSPLYSFNTDLFNVARFIRESGHKEAIKEFEDNNKETQNIYGNYTFSPTYEKIDAEEQKLKRKEQIEVWGAWEKLPIVKRLVYEPDELEAELKAEADKNPSFQWAFLNFIGVAGELEKIRQGKESANDIIIFRIKDYRNYAQRVHNFITSELIKSDTENNQEKLDFDEDESILYFSGKKIKISKRAQNMAHDLLKTLFRDKTKIWNNDEVLDDWHYGLTGEKVPKNKVYQAGKAVNRTVAIKTQIEDFLDLTTKTVSINKKYLEQ
jgi:hypothetical protein